MSTRELAINVIKSLSDENMIARLESDILANDPDSKKYDSFQEFMDEMEQDNVLQVASL